MAMAMAMVVAANCLCGPASAMPRGSDRAKGPLFLSLRKRVLVQCRRPYGIVLRAATADGAQLDSQGDGELVQQRMQVLADSMTLPDNYLSQLPNDLRSDLNYAAFALANGPVQRECGELAGEKLLQLSQAWEKGDTQAATLAAEELRYVLPGELASRGAIGRRLIGAGKHFASTGSYAEGELQKIAKALTGAGEALYVSDAFKPSEEPSLPATRMYKFGELQVELTVQKCYIGCLIAFGFGALSWGLTTSLQNLPESSLQYANDNATSVATSLRGALLLLGSGCTLLSSFAFVGLLGLAIQLSMKQKIDS